MSAALLDVGALARRLLGRLSALQGALATLPLDHPAHGATLQAVAEAFAELLNASGPQTMRLGAAHLLVGGVAIPGAEAEGAALQALLGRHGAGGFELRASPSAQDVATLFRVLGSEPDPIRPLGAAQSAIMDGGCSSLGLIPATPTFRELVVAREATARTALRTYARGLRAVGHLFQQGASAQVVTELTRVAREVVELVHAWPDQALALVEPDGALPYLVRHPVHMAILGVSVGRRLGLRTAQLHDLALCMFAVDCGMPGVPEEIRSHPGRLDAAQRAAVEVHPILGVAILLQAPRLTPGISRLLRVAFEHHVGMDREGYPNPLRWPELHPYSRIAAVVDAYDSLRSTTPWRPGFAMLEALQEVDKGMGQRFDPHIVDLLRDVLGHVRPIDPTDLPEAFSGR